MLATHSSRFILLLPVVFWINIVDPVDTQQQPPFRLQSPPILPTQFQQSQPPQALPNSNQVQAPVIQQRSSSNNNGTLQPAFPQQLTNDPQQQQPAQSSPQFPPQPNQPKLKPTKLNQTQTVEPQSTTAAILLPKPTFFQLTSTILSSGGSLQNFLQHHHLSQFQIWYLTSQILPTITENLKQDYITMLQPSSLVKGIPAVNMSEALSFNNPEVLKTIVEQSSGMLASQQGVIVQKLRNRLNEPFILRMIMDSENPAELLSYFSPNLLMKNIGAIIKAVGEAGIGQVRLLPQNVLLIWLGHVRKLQPQLTGVDLVGRSPVGGGNHLELTLIGYMCSDITQIPTKDVLMVLNKYRQQLSETKRVTAAKGYNLNVRNCWMDAVVQYLKLKNGTSPDQNVLTLLDPAEVSAIGGEVFTSVPARALVSLPTEIKQAILQEIAQIDLLELINLSPEPELISYANELYDTLSASNNSSSSPPQAQIPPQQPVPFRMGSLLFYSTKLLASTELSKEMIIDVLQSKLGPKTICPSASLRSKWSSFLTSTFGGPEKWAGTELISFGDLLVTLSKNEWDQISTDTLSKVVGQLIKQTGFHLRIGKKSFIENCLEQFGDPNSFYENYKHFMRKLFKATQQMVSSIKTVDQVMGDLGKSANTGAPPRVRRSQRAGATGQPPLVQARSTSASSNIPPQTTSSQSPQPPGFGAQRPLPIPVRSPPPTGPGGRFQPVPPFQQQQPFPGRPQPGAPFQPPNVQQQNGTQQLNTITQPQHQHSSNTTSTDTSDNKDSGVLDMLLTRNAESEQGSLTTTTNLTTASNHTTSGGMDVLSSRSASGETGHSGDSGHAPRTLGSHSISHVSALEIPLTCQAIKSAGPIAIGLEPTDITQLSAENLFDCLEPLGLVEWTTNTKRELLNVVSDKLGWTAANLNALSLIELGGLVSGLESSSEQDGVFGLVGLGREESNVIGFDVNAIDLSYPRSLDTLSVLGTRIRDERILKVLGTNFASQNKLMARANRRPIAAPESLRVLVTSLGNILCGLDMSLITTIFESDHSLFVDTSSVLGRLHGCSSQKLSLLAEFAVQPGNYGPTKQWTAFDVETIGVLMAGLDASKYSELPPEAMQGLLPSAMKQMPTSTVQSLSLEQLSNIPYETALAVPSEAVALLARDQLAAIDRVVNLNMADFNVEDVDTEFARSLDENKTTNENETLSGRAGGTDQPSVNGKATPDDASDEEVEIIVVEPDSKESDTEVSDSEGQPENEPDTGAPPPSSASTPHTEFTILHILGFLVFIFRAGNYI